MVPRLSLCCPSEILMGLCRLFAPLPPLALSLASALKPVDLMRTFGDTMALLRASLTCKSGENRHGKTIRQAFGTVVRARTRTQLRYVVSIVGMTFCKILGVSICATIGPVYWWRNLCCKGPVLALFVLLAPPPPPPPSAPSLPGTAPFWRWKVSIPPKRIVGLVFESLINPGTCFSSCSPLALKR